MFPGGPGSTEQMMAKAVHKLGTDILDAALNRKVMNDEIDFRNRQTRALQRYSERYDALSQTGNARYGEDD